MRLRLTEKELDEVIEKWRDKFIPRVRLKSDEEKKSARKMLISMINKKLQMEENEFDVEMEVMPQLESKIEEVLDE